MRFSLKNLLIFIFAKWLKCLSPSNRAKIIIRLIRLSIKKDLPKENLQFLLELDNLLYLLEGKVSVEYGKGIHTKHRHINYHQFFINNIKEGERILDIGSGNGYLSYDVVTHVQDVKVSGIEMSVEKINFARSHYNHPNLEFIHGDALKKLPEGNFDVVILSNILEHIDKRISFLKTITKKVKPNRLIIRVPAFEQDWRVPLKKELGIDYRLDSTHMIEYSHDDFFKELRRAGLNIEYTESRWGEIWSVVKPL